jgi:acyl-CoA thioesterase-1
MATHMGNPRTISTSDAGRWLLRLFTIITFAGLISVAAKAKDIHIVAFGDSLTAGYNLPSGKDFASQLAAGLKRRGHDVRVTNAGVSGDTTGGGLARFDWAVPDDADAVILELGANDALRGISPGIARKNLAAILGKLRQRGLAVLVAGMKAPANWGDAYVRDFNAIYPELAAQHNALLYPFFMEGVIDRPELKLEDALHPNAKGVGEIVRRIMPLVEDLIGQVRTRRAD